MKTDGAKKAEIILWLDYSHKNMFLLIIKISNHVLEKEILFHFLSKIICELNASENEGRLLNYSLVVIESYF